jgi:hypothetical protein
MPQKSTRLNALESRKRLLLAESELNRAQMVEDLGALKSDVSALVDRVTSLGSITSSVAALVSGVAAFRGEKPENGDGKSHWLRRVIKGASLVSSLWRAFRPKHRDRKEGVGEDQD